MTLLQRLGLVAWWVGALFGTLMLAFAFISANSPDHPGAGASIYLLAMGIVTPTLWALSFILAGSFWTPPRGRY